MNQINQFRVLSIALTARGFGYAVLEGPNSLVAYGAKEAIGKKNLQCIALIGKMIARNKPDFLVLDDVNAKGVHRQTRIKRLHGSVTALVKKRKLKMVKISAFDLRRVLLGNPQATKHEVATLLAHQYPVQLLSRLPPKRKVGNSEDRRMDIFDAVALATVSRMSEKQKVLTGASNGSTFILPISQC